MKGEEVKYALLAAVILVGSAAAYNVYIYNYDSGDLIWDPVLGDSVDTGYWVEQLLLASGDNVDSGETLPSDLSSYDAVFMMMGIYTC